MPGTPTKKSKSLRFSRVLERSSSGDVVLDGQKRANKKTRNKKVNADFNASLDEDEAYEELAKLYDKSKSNAQKREELEAEREIMPLLGRIKSNSNMSSARETANAKANYGYVKPAVTKKSKSKFASRGGKKRKSRATKKYRKSRK